MTDTPAQAAAANTETPAAPATPAPVAETVESLPAWAQKLITDTRNEAAKHRTEKVSAVEAAKAEAEKAFEAKLTELSAKQATAAAELESTRVANLKLRSALAVGVPSESAAEFAELLQGSTEEEITAHAEKVKGLIGVRKSDPAVDPTQGAHGAAPKVDPGPGIDRIAAAYGRNQD